MSRIDTPLVSVLMPAYNVEAFIGEAVHSILEQTYPHFELLISDDGSADQTARVLSDFHDPRIQVMHQPKNLGYVDNMNVLLQAAKGEFLVIQDADDYSDKNRLQVLVDFLQSHPLIDAVGSSYIKVEGQQEEKINMPTDTLTIQQAFEQGEDPLPVLNGALMFSRKIIEQRIFFRQLNYVSRGQDDDWLFRISEKFHLANVPDFLYYYRSNAFSMTLNPSLMDYNNLIAADFVRFLKHYRTTNGKDALQEKDTAAVESFLKQKKDEFQKQTPAYLEIYTAHKYLAYKNKGQALKWLFKALWKDTGNLFIWKKIAFVILKEKS